MGLERWVWGEGWGRREGAQDKGFAEARGAEGSSSPWEVDRARRWVLGGCGSQLPTPIYVCFSHKNWIGGPGLSSII